MVRSGQASGSEEITHTERNTMSDEDNATTGDDWKLESLGELAPIIEAGGIFNFARKAGMLKA